MRPRRNTLVQPLQKLSARERYFPMAGSSDPSARSAARASRLDMGEFFAVLDRRDHTIRQCETFLDEYDAWLMPGMPDAAFIRQSQKQPLVIDGVPHPYFFAGTSYNHLASFTGQPSIVLPCGFSRTACRSACSSPASAGARRSCSVSPKVLEKLLPPCPLPFLPKLAGRLSKGSRFHVIRPSRSRLRGFCPAGVLVLVEGGEGGRRHLGRRRDVLAEITSMRWRMSGSWKVAIAARIRVGRRSPAAPLGAHSPFQIETSIG